MLPESAGARAEELFKSGLNCAQAVYLTFAEELGLDENTAKLAASGLGGGVGRMREVCGAVTGATLALGHRFGADKNAIYENVQKLCADFKAETGSIICREMLAMSQTGADGVEVGGRAEERTASYYKKRPCPEIVRLGAMLAAAIMQQETQNENNDIPEK